MTLVTGAARNQGHRHAVALADEGADIIATNLLPAPFIEAEDVTNVVVRLASDKARYVTGATPPVDAGYTAL